MPHDTLFAEDVKVIAPNLKAALMLQYRLELLAHPPTPGFSGANRENAASQAARKDVARLLATLDTLGLRIIGVEDAP